MPPRHQQLLPPAIAQRDRAQPGLPAQWLRRQLGLPAQWLRRQPGPPPQAQEDPRHERTRAHPLGPQTHRAVSTGEEPRTRDGRLLTPIGAAASAFQAGAAANKAATPAKAKSIFLDIKSSLDHSPPRLCSLTLTRCLSCALNVRIREVRAAWADCSGGWLKAAPDPEHYSV